MNLLIRKFQGFYFPCDWSFMSLGRHLVFRSINFWRTPVFSGVLCSPSPLQWTHWLDFIETIFHITTPVSWSSFLANHKNFRELVAFGSVPAPLRGHFTWETSSFFFEMMKKEKSSPEHQTAVTGGLEWSKPIQSSKKALLVFFICPKLSLIYVTFSGKPYLCRKIKISISLLFV